MATVLKWKLMMAQRPSNGVRSSSGIKLKPKKRMQLGAKSKTKGKPGNKAVGGKTDSSQSLIRRFFCPEERGNSLGSSSTQGSRSTKKFSLSLQNNPTVKTSFDKANKLRNWVKNPCCYLSSLFKKLRDCYCLGSSHPLLSLHSSLARSCNFKRTFNKKWPVEL